MYKTSGNVAYNSQPMYTNERKNYILSTEYRERHNALSRRVCVNSERENIRAEKILHRQMARQRVAKIIKVLLILGVLVAVSTGILYRYSVIMEKNYANVRMEREITQLTDDTNLIREELSKKTDLSIIRTKAVELLFMQDPAQKQMVRVTVPQTDKMIIDDQSLYTDGQSQDMDAVFNNLEGFFKKLR